MAGIEPRILPLPQAEWDDKARTVFGMIHGPDRWKYGARFNIMRTLAHHPDLAVPYLSFSRQLLKASSLPDRIREIATLRISWLCNSDYEWSQHAVLALQIGMTNEEIEAAKAGAGAPVWSESERDVLRAVDELKTTSTLTDTTWNALAKQFDQRQMIDFLFIVGHYAMLAMVMNAIGVEVEQL